MNRLTTARAVWPVLGLLALAGPATGQVDPEAEARAEEQRRESFRAGMAEIVEDLNGGSFERFINAIDQPDMLERIFGLRLINPKIKQQFAEQFEYSIEPMVRSSFANESAGERAVLLRVDSRGDQGVALVRYDLPGLQFDYHEYELRLDKKGRLVIVDWIGFLWGERFSDGVGASLVAALPSASAVRKLVDIRNISESQIFQVTELLKAGRDMRADKFFEIREALPPELRRQRVVVIEAVHLSKTIGNRRLLRQALIDVAEYFPNDPLYSLMLLDYYFPTRQYDAAWEALERLETRLGVEDAAMQARLSATALVLDRAGDAAAHAERAVEMDPAVELGWWSLLRAAAVSGEYGRAIAAIDRLNADFGHALDANALGRDPAFSRLIASAEFRDWAAAAAE